MLITINESLIVLLFVSIKIW